MRRLIALGMSVCLATTVLAQADTTGKQTQPDTLRIGGIVIIRKGGHQDKQSGKVKELRIRNRKHSGKPSNLTTNWWIVDLGFAGTNDKTNYSSAAAQAYAPGSNETWFELKNIRSRTVNVWFFMQKLNIASHVLNLKYGLGLELNNYHYKRPIRYDDDPPATPNPPVVMLDATPNRTYDKNKLAADYLTMPVMLNVNFTPHKNNNFGFSTGISAGFLYSARNKTKTSDEGKEKAKDDFGLERWKLSWVGEISLGPVRLFGNYALSSMYERGLDITPYSFGFRFSNW